MTRSVITSIFILIASSAYAQNGSELAKRNGFKDLKLGTSIDSVNGAKLKKEFKEKDQYDAKLYTLENEDYKKIGEVDVNKIEIKTYKDLIYEISVITDKDPRLMKALESIYGKADYDMKNETYFWKAETISLKFKAHNKQKLEMLYTSYTIHKMMKDDKDKKVDDIANDF